MDKNTFITPIIKTRIEGEGIAEYWLYNDNSLFKKFSTFMNRPIFTAGQMPVSYRVLNHWCNAGLLPDGIVSDGTWRKMTFVERVWIGIVSHLRDFGVPLEKIFKAKKDIMIFDKKCNGYVMFEYYISKAISSTDDPYFIMLSDGTADIGNTNEIELNKIDNDPFDMILISIKSVLKSLGEKAYTSKPLVGLNEEEMKIFEAIRSENNEELFIKLQNGRIIETNKTKSKHGKPKISDILSEIKKNKDYADVIIKFQDGVPEMVKVSKKHRSKIKPSE